MMEEKPIDCTACDRFDDCTHELKRLSRICRDFSAPCDACDGPMYPLERRWTLDDRLKYAEYACKDPDCGSTYRVSVVSPADDDWGP